VIYLILLVGSIWAGVKYLPELFAPEKAKSVSIFEDSSIHQKLDASANVKSEGQVGGFTAGTMYFGQDQTNPGTTLFIAQQVWIETKGNLSELQKMLDDPTEGMPKVQGIRFAHDAYDKYGERLSRSTAAQQMINFYEQLKRLERGSVYTHAMISETIGQGRDVINLLQKDFNIRDYFSGANDSEPHVLSADASIVSGPENVQSAGNYNHQEMNNSPGSIQVGGDYVVQETFPRVISNAQRETMIALLKSYAGSKIKINVNINDNESRDLAEQIKEVFTISGWDADIFSIIAAVNYGKVSMRIKDKTNYPVRARVIQKALRMTEFGFEAFPEPTLAVDDVVICIGPQ
jgi:hypothetical protein